MTRGEEGFGRRLVGFVVAGVLVSIGLLLAWYMLIEVSSGAFSECDRGDCGTLGESNDDLSPGVPLAALALGRTASWWRILRQ